MLVCVVQQLRLREGGFGALTLRPSLPMCPAVSASTLADTPARWGGGGLL